jgi:formylglycine-generating enzyme required for sulfatase activity
LPTKAQQEYAARGGYPSTGIPWTYTYAGCNKAADLEDYAWYTINSSNSTHPVKTKTPNSLGRYDMSGNVREWHWDRLGGGGAARGFPGGCWDNGANFCKVGYGSGSLPDYRGNETGFRVVCGD